MNLVRDGYATATCGFCGDPLTGRAGQVWCSTTCRQRAWRRSTSAPVAPAVVAKSDVVYECPSCEERSLDRRCPECNLWCRRLGAGGPCPHCDELVVLSDILDAEQLVSQPHSRQRVARSVSQPGV
jgi:hypothetical protein